MQALLPVVRVRFRERPRAATPVFGVGWSGGLFEQAGKPCTRDATQEAGAHHEP